MTLPERGALQSVEWPAPFDAIIRTAHLEPIQSLERLISIQNVQQLRGHGLEPPRWAILIGALSRLGMAREGGIWEGTRAANPRAVASLCLQLSLNLPTPDEQTRSLMREKWPVFPNMQRWLLQAALSLDPADTSRSLRKQLKRTEAARALEQHYLDICNARPDLILDGTLREAFKPLKMTAHPHLIALMEALNRTPEVSPSQARDILAVAWETPPEPAPLMEEWQAFTTAGLKSRNKPTFGPQMKLARAALRVTQHPALRLPAHICAEAVPDWLWDLREGATDRRNIWKELSANGQSLKPSGITETWFTGDYTDCVTLDDPASLARQIRTDHRPWEHASGQPGRHLKLQSLALNCASNQDILVTLMREENKRRNELNVRCARTWQLPALTNMIAAVLNHPDLQYMREHLHYRLNFETIRQLTRDLADHEARAGGYAPASLDGKNLHQTLPQSVKRSVAQAVIPVADLTLRHISSQLEQTREQLTRGHFNKESPALGLPEVLLAQAWEQESNNPSVHAERHDQLHNILIEMLSESEST